MIQHSSGEISHLCQLKKKLRGLFQSCDAAWAAVVPQVRIKNEVEKSGRNIRCFEVMK